MNDLPKRIANFKLRIETDGRQFCEELYHHAGVRVMAHKYSYYVCSNPIHNDKNSDIAYDIEEKSWYVMGRALGHLQEDETSPCVDYDAAHPLAKEGRAMAERLMRK